MSNDLHRTESPRRPYTVRGLSYDVALDFTVGAERLRSTTTVSFDAVPGAETFVDFVADRVTAYQSSALPLPAEAIEQAIAMNGAQVDANIQAFRRGRQLISGPAAFHDPAGSKPAAVATVLPHTQRLVDLVRAQPGSELARLVAIRVPDLVAYQSASYARRYAEFVERIRRTEAARCPKSTAVVEAVARQLHKLTAYKDEYEVARLSLRPEPAAAGAEQFGPGVKIAYRPHPRSCARSAGARRSTSGRGSSRCSAFSWRCASSARC